MIVIQGVEVIMDGVVRTFLSLLQGLHLVKKIISKCSFNVWTTKPNGNAHY